MILANDGIWNLYSSDYELEDRTHLSMKRLSFIIIRGSHFFQAEVQLNEIRVLSPNGSRSGFKQIYSTLLHIVKLYAVKQLLRAVRCGMEFGPWNQQIRELASFIYHVGFFFRVSEKFIRARNKTSRETKTSFLLTVA